MSPNEEIGQSRQRLQEIEVELKQEISSKNQVLKQYDSLEAQMTK